MSSPRAACGVTPQGAMPADWQSQIGGIPGQSGRWQGGSALK